MIFFASSLGFFLGGAELGESSPAGVARVVSAGKNTLLIVRTPDDGHCLVTLSDGTTIRVGEKADVTIGDDGRIVWRQGAFLVDSPDERELEIMDVRGRTLRVEGTLYVLEPQGGFGAKVIILAGRARGSYDERDSVGAKEGMALYFPAAKDGKPMVFHIDLARFLKGTRLISAFRTPLTGDEALTKSLQRQTRAIEKKRLESTGFALGGMSEKGGLVMLDSTTGKPFVGDSLDGNPVPFLALTSFGNQTGPGNFGVENTMFNSIQSRTLTIYNEREMNVSQIVTAENIIQASDSGRIIQAIEVGPNNNGLISSGVLSLGFMASNSSMVGGHSVTIEAGPPPSGSGVTLQGIPLSNQGVIQNLQVGGGGAGRVNFFGGTSGYNGGGLISTNGLGFFNGGASNITLQIGP